MIMVEKHFSRDKMTATKRRLNAPDRNAAEHAAYGSENSIQDGVDHWP